jgi:DinB superfamily
MRSPTSWAVLAAIALFGKSASAQTALQRDDAIEVRTQLLADLDTLQVKLTALANAFPEDKYSWRPDPGVRSVGEVFMHIASEFYGAPVYFGGKQSTAVPQEKDGWRKFEHMSTKADVLKHLAASRTYYTAAIEAADPGAFRNGLTFAGQGYSLMRLSFLMTGDVHEHLGQLVAYARMNGITPPWSKKP